MKLFSRTILICASLLSVTLWSLGANAQTVVGPTGQVAGPVESPTICVGSKWRYQRTELAGPQKGNVTEDYTNAVESVSGDLYHIVRTQLGGEVSRYSITKARHEQVSAVPTSITNIVSYDFPLNVGKQYKATVRFVNTAVNVTGTSSMTYEVTNLETFTLGGKEYRTLKIVGGGWWNVPGVSGRAEDVVYYAPQVGAYVQYFRKTGAFDSRVTNLVSYELKTDCSPSAK